MASECAFQAPHGTSQSMGERNSGMDELVTVTHPLNARDAQ